MALSGNHVPDVSTGHTADHNLIDFFINAQGAQIAQTIAVNVYSGGAYPARPVGFAQVRYIGPVAPTDAHANDEWINNS